MERKMITRMKRVLTGERSEVKGGKEGKEK